MAAQMFLSPVGIVIALLTLNGTAAFRPAFTPRTVGTSLDAMSRRDVLSTSAAAALVVGLPLDAMAAAAAKPKDLSSNPASFAFNGVFKDPKHPDGYRIISGSANKEGTLTGQDDAKSEVFKIPIQTTKDNKGKITLSIDFSSKGGPADVVATVNKDSSILFPDGNVWKKEGGVVGVYIDGYAPYPKYRRVIRQDGSKLTIDMVNGKKTFSIIAEADQKLLTVQFPGKTCAAKINTKKGTISFADGNTWTKV